MNLIREDIEELLVVLNVALVDTNEHMRHTDNPEALDAHNKHREIIRKWIHRLSQSTQGSSDQAHEDWANDE